MADAESFEALPPETHPRQRQKESESNHENEEDEEKAEQKQEPAGKVTLTKSQNGELQGLRASEKAEPRDSSLETLGVPSSMESVRNDQCADVQGSSTSHMAGENESKEPVGPSDKEIVSREAVQAAQTLTQKENQLQVSVRPTSLSELSPTSVTQSLSSVPSPTVPDQRPSPLKVNNVHTPGADKKTHSSGKSFSAVSVVRTPSSDGYNWRKYGQKQVKSPTGSRSYYRCTHSECCAKKIECCDDSGHVIEIVYRSQHTHDPPRKTNPTRNSRLVQANEPAVENSVLQQPIRVLNDSEPSRSSKEPLQEAPCSTEKKQQLSSDHGENGKVILKEEQVNESESKKRMKKDDLMYSDSPVKAGKKPKFVVHAEGDVGISADGYRWRKYGQKMVKGNPHPRNYYRCTSAGCPVRKHIETSVDNSNGIVITYKGVHDHDMPVPKKRHGPPNPPLVAAAAPASMSNSQFKKTDSLQNKKPSTQWSVDTEGELSGKALELGGEKAIESARTLLSIGFEIKPC